MDLYSHIVKCWVCSSTSLLISEFSVIERLGKYLNAVLVHRMSLAYNSPVPAIYTCTGRRETALSHARLKTQLDDPVHGLNRVLSIRSPTLPWVHCSFTLLEEIYFKMSFASFSQIQDHNSRVFIAIYLCYLVITAKTLPSKSYARKEINTLFFTQCWTQSICVLKSAT